MLPNRIRIRYRPLFLRLCLVPLVTLLFLPSVCESQYEVLSNQVYDPTTQRLLGELERMLMINDLEKAEILIKKIIDGSGHIRELAKIQYSLAQNDTDCDSLMARYRDIIENWYDSAWAQKAVIELVPLILMSGGTGQSMQEKFLWDHEQDLLSPAKDAALVGENPDDLRADVYIKLLQLAHFHNDNAHVNQLVSLSIPKTRQYQDQIDLATAYSILRERDLEKAHILFDQWLQTYKDSNMAPLAHLGLFQSSETDEQLDRALQQMVDGYHDSLEALWLLSRR